MIRDYQQTAIQQLNAFFETEDAGILCMPTGSGKTVTFAEIARQWIMRGKHVMVLCNRKELIEQATEKLNSLNLFPTIIDPSYRNAYNQLYVASVDTLRNRALPEIDLLIVDECHIRSFDEIELRYLNFGTKILGCTATPVRSGKKSIEGYEHYTGHLSDIYSTIFEPVTIQSLIEQKWLCEYWHIGASLDLSELKKSRNLDGEEEFSSESLKKVFNKQSVYIDVIGKYTKFSLNESAICFNSNVEQSLAITKEFQLQNIASEHIDGKTKKNIRKDIFKKFVSGEIKVLNNVGIATTGTDIPYLQNVILNLSTLSLSKYLQMIGRGSRRPKGKQCKGPGGSIAHGHFKVIDMGNNYIRHGYWDQPRIYTLEKEYKPVGTPVLIMCGNCESIIPASSSVCKFCQTENEHKKIAAEKKESEAVDAEFDFLDKAMNKPLKDMSIEELERYRILKKYELGWMVHQLLPRGKESLFEYQRLRNFSPNWAPAQIAQQNKKREIILDGIWNFIQANPHLQKAEIEKEAFKKMKSSFSSEEIKAMIPKILEAV